VGKLAYDEMAGTRLPWLGWCKHERARLGVGSIILCGLLSASAGLFGGEH
jgi:hypothetical protein